MQKIITIRVPQSEYSKLSGMLAGLAQSLSQKMKSTIKPPSAGKSLVTYAFRELQKEELLKRAPIEQRRAWGQVILPSWLRADIGEQLTIVQLEMGEAGYERMMAWMKDLYPDVYNIKKINNDDFIGALGITYAHRIMAGNVSLEVALP